MDSYYEMFSLYLTQVTQLSFNICKCIFSFVSDVCVMFCFSWVLHWTQLEPCSHWTRIASKSVCGLSWFVMPSDLVVLYFKNYCVCTVFVVFFYLWVYSNNMTGLYFVPSVHLYCYNILGCPCPLSLYRALMTSYSKHRHNCIFLILNSSLSLIPSFFLSVLSTI